MRATTAESGFVCGSAVQTIAMAAMAMAKKKLGVAQGCGGRDGLMVFILHLQREIARMVNEDRALNVIAGRIEKVPSSVN